MKFPIDIKIYLKSGKYIGDGKIIKGIQYPYNILHNIDGYLNGHPENKEKTGFKYGCGFGQYANPKIDNFSIEKWIKYINEQYLTKFIIVIKNTCFFEDIEL